MIVESNTLLNRFLHYTTFNTTTNIENGAKHIMPSCAGQMALAKYIETELQAIGLTDICLRDNAILTATLPSNSEQKLPTVAFFAHLDTSCELTTDAHPQVIKYEGGDIQLKNGLLLTVEENPELSNYLGGDIVVTDGTSLLGADDKAAIAAIVSAIAEIKHSGVEHGQVKIAFLPDEEQGMLGAKAFDADAFGADFGYTLDCCGIGEFICENWNAGHAVVTFTGKSAHPMNAKGNLVNSLLLAQQFMSMFPAEETPECTEGREGYYWMKKLGGNAAKTILNIDIRDFTEEGYAERKAFIGERIAMFNAQNNDRATLEVFDSYNNVASFLTDFTFPVDLALSAYKEQGIEAKIIPMRGGYDGSIISEKGIPCPNLFTGAHNFHSVFEYLPVSSLDAACNVVQTIIQNIAKQGAR